MMAEEVPCTVSRRKCLPAKQLDPSIGSVCWSFLKNSLGKNLTRAGFPLGFLEPINWLQEVATETAEYSGRLLKEASNSDDPVRRMELVVAYFLSSYHQDHRRLAVNPIMGETYEAERPELGFRVFLEQIQHHPPSIAFQVDSVDSQGKPDDHFTVKGTNCIVRAGFNGLHVELFPEHFRLVELHQRNEVYWTIGPPTLTVGGILHHGFLRGLGKLNFQCCKLNSPTEHLLRCELDFVLPKSKLGLFWTLGIRLGHGHFDVMPKIEGIIFNAQGQKLRSLYGKYTVELYSTPVESWTESNGWEAESVKALHASTLAKMEDPRRAYFDMDLPNQRLVWRRDPLPENAMDYYGFSEFVMTLNELEPNHEKRLPPTDSRFRPDMQLFEQGKLDEAQVEKFRLEEKQRAAQKGQGTGRFSKWFNGPVDLFDSGKQIWVSKNEYWARDWTRCKDANLF